MTIESQPAEGLDHSLDSRSFFRSLALWREAAEAAGRARGRPDIETIYK